MKVELTNSQCKNLAEFIDFYFIESIRQDEDIDNLEYIKDMMSAHDALLNATDTEKEKEDKMIYDADECLKFIKKIHPDIVLFDYQKEMIKAMCENKLIATSRCVGRSMVSKFFSEYVEEKWSSNDYTKHPSVIFDYTYAIDNNFLSEETLKHIKRYLTKEEFDKEYNCKF